MTLLCYASMRRCSIKSQALSCAIRGIFNPADGMLSLTVPLEVKRHGDARTVQVCESVDGVD